MCMYMYARVRLVVRIPMYKYIIYRDIFVHMNVFLCINIFLCTDTHIYMYICILCLNIFLCIYTHTHICVCIYIYKLQWGAEGCRRVRVSIGE